MVIIDGYKAEILLSADTLFHLEKSNEYCDSIDELILFGSLIECRYDPETGDVFNVPSEGE